MSAIIGKPPATEQDYWIIRGMLLSASVKNATLAKLDPAKGYPLAPKRPASGHFGPDLTNRLFIAAVFVACFCFVMTATRLSLRGFRLSMSWGADDWVIIPAVLMICTQAGIYAAMSKVGGIGKHYWDCTYEEYKNLFFLLHLGNIIFFASLALVKISIVLFLRRMIGLSSRKWRITADVLLVLLIMYLFTSIITFVFRISPPRNNFDLVWAGHQQHWGKEINYPVANAAFAIMHIIFDFMLLVIPVAILWRTTLAKNQKVRFTLLFGLGCLTCIATLIRNAYVQKPLPDMTYWTADINKWALVELALSVIVANMPILNLLFVSLEAHVSSVVRSISKRSTRGSSGNRSITIGESTGGDPDTANSQSVPTANRTSLVRNIITLGRPQNNNTLHTVEEPKNGANNVVEHEKDTSQASSFV